MGPNFTLDPGQIVLIDMDTGEEIKLGEIKEAEIECELSTTPTGKPILNHNKAGEITCELRLTRKGQRKLRILLWRIKLRLAWHALTGK